ncbi:hypothetical protein [Ensifer aridi]|uniref:hypothetical protein n=1 Tax=Ensifer aridi TaxID=1708715 RepID=UPI000A118A23|nr:hypothetical protein [Ensifer aridi]
MTAHAMQKQITEAFPASEEIELDEVATPDEEPKAEEGIDHAAVFGLAAKPTATTKPKPKFVVEPAPFPHGINPRWDVAQIATEGHVLTARVQDWSHRKYSTAICAFFGAVGLFIAGQAYLPFLKQPPVGIISALTYDPDTYFNLGGGLHGPYEISWIGDFAPKVGLTEKEYGELVDATVKDLSEHQFDAADWSTVAGLKKAPKITRPEKVFTQWSERLEDGVISLPEAPKHVAIVAHVQGQWGVTLARPGDCLTVQGPIAEGCEDGIDGKTEALSKAAYQVLMTMKPADVAEKEQTDGK